MVRRQYALAWAGGVVWAGVLAGTASAEPHYYFVDADTTSVPAGNYDLNLQLIRDSTAFTDGATDNVAEVMSFANSGAAPTYLASGGTVLGNLKTNLTLTDKTNANSSFYDATLPIGTRFTYVLGLASSRLDPDSSAQLPGYAGFSMSLSKNSTAYLENGDGFGYAVEAYIDGVPSDFSAPTISRNANILVGWLTAGTRPSAQTTNWTGGTGVYSDAAKWTGGLPTIAGAIDTVINSTPGTPSQVTLDRGGVARTLRIGADSTLGLDGYGMTIKGKLMNEGTVNVDGTFTFLFDAKVEGSGTTNVVKDLVGKGDLTIDPGQTVQLVGHEGRISVDGAFTNKSIVYTASGVDNDLSARDGIVNEGTLRAMNSGLMLHAASIVNNGTIQSVGAGSAIHLNPDQLPLQTITGTGGWDIGNGLSLDGKVDVHNDGMLVVQPGAVVSSSPAGQGSTFAVGGLSGGASSSTVALGDGSTLTILDGGATYNGKLSGGMKLVKNGSGKQVVTGDQTFSGGTVVNNGILELDAPFNAAGDGTVQVNAGGTLAGDARINTFAEVAEGGMLAPGSDGSGTLSFFGLKLFEGSVLNLDLSNTGPSDLVSVFNSATHVGGTTVNITNAGLAVGQVAWFFTYAGTLVTDANGGGIGSLSIGPGNFTLGALPPGVQGYLVGISDTVGGLQSGQVGFMTTAVPEPAGLALVLGAGVLGLRRRRPRVRVG